MKTMIEMRAEFSGSYKDIYTAEVREAENVRKACNKYFSETHEKINHIVISMVALNLSWNIRNSLIIPQKPFEYGLST